MKDNKQTSLPETLSKDKEKEGVNQGQKELITGLKQAYNNPKVEKEDSQEIEFPEWVGKCNRLDKCGYHYTPKDYFKDNPDAIPKTEYNPIQSLIKRNTKKPKFAHKTPKISPTYMEQDLLIQSVKSQNHKYYNNFVGFLLDLFGEEIVQELRIKYCIGTAKKWKGATVFWQLDEQERIRAGKIMLYDRKTGKRVKKPYNHISWVHSEMNLKGFNLTQCFFGQHLLPLYPELPVGIVESEKTAILASVMIPDILWLATGGKNGCGFSDTQNLQALKGRKIALYPDLGAEKEWMEKAKGLEKAIQAPVSISTYLSSITAKEQRENGWDLADFLLQYRCKKSGWMMGEGSYPLFGDL